jgi:hypothetical protein
MVVMFESPIPWKGNTPMANREITPVRLDWKAVLTSDGDGFPALLQAVVQEVLKAEMA